MVSADLGTYCLHSKIVDQDLQCLSDKIDFTTNCSTLYESFIFLFIYFLLILLLLLSADFSFSKLMISKNSFRNTLIVSNSLDSDRDWWSGSPKSGSQLSALT